MSYINYLINYVLLYKFNRTVVKNKMFLDYGKTNRYSDSGR